jgi:arabinogalactan oligomer/maltooligosaccharide transport system substrate-binding protein
VAAAPAIQALLAQSEYSSLQRIGGNYWTPTSEFGVSMSEGNPSGKDLQLELDNMVEAITATYGN